MNPRLQGLYAITDTTPSSSNEQLLTAAQQAIHGGVRILQYRDKSDDQPRRRQQATLLLGLCRQHGVTFIINDDVALAAAIGADGVHLGRDDGDIDAARQQLRHGIVGLSCYNEWPLAKAAAAAGADYVAFGAFFPSTTKPHAARAAPDLLERSRQELDIPVVAIGGITPDNGRDLIAAGADMLAVVQGVFGQPDIQAAARRYAALF
ncbi:MAG: thiamine phosphate synthase [Pseudomonadota bacterium]|nr:thiamine phosphate synthase [Pseudomonadota bacterium]